MKQAQVLQQRFQEAQEKVHALEAEGQSGGGMVKVTLNGKGLARGVRIDPALIDPADAVRVRATYTRPDGRVEAEDAIDTTIGVVRLPGRPPTPCLSATTA